MLKKISFPCSLRHYKRRDLLNVNGCIGGYRHVHSITRRILKSNNTNVYTNLAIEDWLFLNSKDTEETLILWRNDPCVVIGRHQNPWVEANLPFISTNNINIARRNSGGGTVYHDLGNLNLSFITSKDLHNRKKNLELICKSLVNIGLDPVINCRDDILLNGNKISGTAAKISRNRAYHHCTILVNVNREILRSSIKNPHSHIIQTNATKSVRSPIENISNKENILSVEVVENAIAKEYADANVEVINENLVNMDEVEQIAQQLRSWKWIFGKTPKFSIEHSFSIGAKKIDISFSVVNGHIEELLLNSVPLMEYSSLQEKKQFSAQTLFDLANRLRAEEKEAMFKLLQTVKKIT